MRKAIQIALFSIVFWSCQKENYELDIKSTDSILIVDGRVQSNKGDVMVNLSKTTGFLGNNPQSLVGDASVFITVNGGDEQMLEYIGEGNYRLDTVNVAVGTDYNLRIVWNEQEFTSFTTMKEMVPVGTFIFEETPSFGPQEDGPTFNFNMILNIDLTQVNYYITEAFVYDSITGEFIDRASLHWDDEAYTNNPAFFPFFVKDFPVGDSVYVKFSQITFETFNFYNTLSDVGGQNPSSLAPANPTSNITNGAIGDFGAFATYEARFVIVP